MMRVLDWISQNQVMSFLFMFFAFGCLGLTIFSVNHLDLRVNLFAALQDRRDKKHELRLEKLKAESVQCITCRSPIDKI